MPIDMHATFATAHGRVDLRTRAGDERREYR
jgi:hypothetical protein